MPLGCGAYLLAVDLSAFLDGVDLFLLGTDGLGVCVLVFRQLLDFFLQFLLLRLEFLVGVGEVGECLDGVFRIYFD